MAIQTINIGNVANDGTGDDLREAFAKVNSNFVDLDAKVDIAEGSDGSNLGLGEGVFRDKTENTLQFRSLVAGSNISLSSGGNSITITADEALKQLIVVSDSGSRIIPAGNQSIRIQGGTNTSTRVTSEDVFIDVEGDGLVALDPTPTLSGQLDANANNIINANSVTSSNFIGNLTGLVHNIDVRELNTFLFGFDFGSLTPTADSFYDFLVNNFDVDFGTFTAPNATETDLGAIV